MKRLFLLLAAACLMLALLTGCTGTKQNDQNTTPNGNVSTTDDGTVNGGVNNNGTTNQTPAGNNSTNNTATNGSTSTNNGTANGNNQTGNGATNGTTNGAANNGGDLLPDNVPGEPVAPNDTAPGNGTVSPDDGTTGNANNGAGNTSENGTSDTQGRSRSLPGMVGRAADDVANAINGR